MGRHILKRENGGAVNTRALLVTSILGVLLASACTNSGSSNGGSSSGGGSGSSGGSSSSSTGGTDVATPVLFFTDIVSGPVTGGQDDLGVFITLYGERLGAQRGASTVTIGGTEVANYVAWGEDNAVARSLDMIVVQPGGSVSTGDVVVTVNGHASNALPFQVRPGNIYFVHQAGTNASDSNPGTFASPFLTLYRPRQVMQPGDVVYIRGGTFNGQDPDNLGWDAVLLLSTDTDPNGTAGQPVAYVGYPGERPTIDAQPPLRRGIYMNEGLNNYVFANLGFTQGLTPYEGMLQMGGNGHRAVGNYLFDSSSSTGMGIAGNSAHYQVFGNFFRNNGLPDWEDGVAFYIQGFGLNDDIDFGWNHIQDQRGRRSIQLFGHVDGDRMDHIRIHDNLLTSTQMLRVHVLLGGSDGATDVLGTVAVYNNVIAGSDWEGLRVDDPQGTVRMQHNTLYDNGTLGPDSRAQVFLARAGDGLVTLQNNILYAEADQVYYDLGTGVNGSGLLADHNLVFNAGPCPTWDATCLNADPQFAARVSNDFQLRAASPAINAGSAAGIGADFLGVARPQGTAPDIGAFERP